MNIRKKDFKYLESLAKKVLSKCKVIKSICLNGKMFKLELTVPSGDMKYPSFWVRDAVMMAASGLITAKEIKGWLELIAYAGQQGPKEELLENELRIPPWSIADHINFDGRPVFFPGTYSSGKNQGSGRFGYYPPHDSQYFFIELAHIYYCCVKDCGFLGKSIKGLTLMQRLENAFESFNIDKNTQLCISDIDKHTVDWGFCDQVVKSGYLLFPSLLRYRAAYRLCELSCALKDSKKAEKYSMIANCIEQNIISKFYDNSGWFLSATGVCRQKDIWGTAFALWLNFPHKTFKEDTKKAMAEAFRNGKSADSGYIRHILVGEDVHADSAWENTFCSYNTYQNGGYWATPTGWYIYSLAKYVPELAEEMLNQYINHTRLNELKGAPFEWRTSNDGNYEGKQYGTSAVLPYEALKRLLKEGVGKLTE